MKNKQSPEDGSSRRSTLSRVLAFSFSMATREPTPRGRVSNAGMQKRAVEFDTSARICLPIQETRWIIIDGLDECVDKELLVPKLIEFVSVVEFNTKLLLVSRGEPVFHNWLDSDSFIEVTTERTRKDVDIDHNYDERRLGKVSFPKRRNRVHDYYFGLIGQRTVSPFSAYSPISRFLCVAFQLNAIKSLRLHSINAIQVILYRLVLSVHGEYDKIFQCMSLLSKIEGELARHILVLMAYTYRPLTFHEWMFAFMIDWQNFWMDTSRLTR